MLLPEASESRKRVASSSTILKPEGNNKIPLTNHHCSVGNQFRHPSLPHEKDTVDPEVRQQIEAVLVKYDEAVNKLRFKPAEPRPFKDYAV
jgi:hypothetical protein